MPAQTYSIDRDLSEARAMAEGLEAYVREDALYGRVGGGGILGGGNMPSLTVGALLLRLRRLTALRERMTPAQQRTLDAAQTQNDAVRREWRLHYDQKMLREAQSRLAAMRAFFDECSDDPRLCASAYPAELLRRTIAQELALALDSPGTDSGDLNELMNTVDARLHRIVKPSHFQWDERLQDVYPSDVFWWLYAEPPAPVKS